MASLSISSYSLAVSSFPTCVLPLLTLMERRGVSSWASDGLHRTDITDTDSHSLPIANSGLLWPLPVPTSQISTISLGVANVLHCYDYGGIPGDD